LQDNACVFLKYHPLTVKDKLFVMYFKSVDMIVKDFITN
jgi:hypothetical protein